MTGPQLARHFIAGNELDTGADYAYRAGERNERLFIWSRAAALYAQAADILAHLPDTLDRRRRRVNAIIKQVSLFYYDQDPERSWLRLLEAERLVDSSSCRDDQVLLVQI